MARQKKDAKKISLNLDNHLLNQIQEYADSHRMTFTATLEMIIDEYFMNMSPQTEHCGRRD